MREMKDSGIEWIGEIPADWNLKKLKHTFTISSGTTPKSDNLEYWDGDIPWVTPADYKTEDKYVYHGRKFLSEAGLNAANLQLLPVNSIIFSKRAPIGAVAITGAKLAINQGCISCVPAIECDIRYYYFILSIYTEQFNLLGSGTTFKEISSKDFGNFTVPAPSVSVQEKLADYLDRKCSQIDAIIARQQEVIEKLKAYKLSVITEAVTKGLNPDVPMKDSGVEWIGKIPEHWKVMKFGRCAMVKSNLVNPDDYADYPQISPDSIEKNSGRIFEYKTVKESGVISWNHLFFQGQIIYSKIRPMLNKVAIAPFDGLCSADMYPIETSNNAQFLVYMMLSDCFTSQVGLVTENRVKMPKINQNELNAIMVVIPPRSEQEIISKYLQKECFLIDARIDRKQKLVGKLIDYKKSLIYEVVTGKKEV